ncbi:uncharacterized protein LOC126801098 [Argentina anserina]|uniref:uncharacterized protein LOC126801098 n=1 Tax=Argentina anserina TaxID=57926 RepID=UPI0021766801|nr:uncharacterized protein LOC126801098 [Potentilla anserina]
MFGFRKPKFTTKCKTDIKSIKVRLEAIKKKRNSVLKYLKNDVADLLKNGLDINAYGRAEGVLVEHNMSVCYQLTESFLDCILSNLSQMQNQSECPEECKEAVSSVIYAAARFSDLPELRDLRNMFTEKYGDSIQAFVNKELVNKFKSKPPTKEMKVQLMHDIAKEHSIEWDSKALEQKLFTPPPTDKAETTHGSQCDSDDDMYRSQRKDNVHSKRKNKGDGDRQRFVTGDTEYKLHSSSDDEATDMSHDGRMPASSSVGSRSEDEAENKVPSSYKFTPPPYYKPKPQKKESAFEEHRKVNSNAEDNAKPRSVRKTPRPPAGSDPRDEEERVMDGLLMHYSRKQSPYDRSNMKGSLKPRNNQSDDDTRHRSSMSERNSPAGRAASLPPPEPSASPEETKRSAQASSFQPEAHVHPRLPEYDDLASRIAALRGI